MELPENLQLARTINANPIPTLAQLLLGSSDVCSLIKPLLPYFTLPTLLLIASRPSFAPLFPPNADSAVKSRCISELLDFQRDWLVEQCPAELRDEYLVDAFASPGAPAWAQLKQDGRFELVMPRGSEVIIKGAATATKGQVCPSLSEFQAELKQVSGGLFDQLDWSNVCLGGGAVLSIMTGMIDADSFKDSDFDLFLYGLEPGQLVPKVQSIIQQLRAAMPGIEIARPKYRGPEQPIDYTANNRGELLFIKGFNAISVVPPLGFHPRRVFQIILASHPTLAETLTDFDLDCCSILYDGSKVLALPRAARALALGDFIYGVNFLDTRLSRKLERYTTTRTIKYKLRGYDLALPPAAAEILRAEHLDSTHLLRAGRVTAANSKASLWELSGLAGLLKYEYNVKRKEELDLGPHADYGPSRVPYWKVIDLHDLEHFENGEIQRRFAQFNYELANMVQSVRGMDQNSNAEVTFVDPYALSLETGAVPYVASFDEDLLLGIGRHPEDIEPRFFFSRGQNQRLVVKIPRSMRSIAEAAQARLNELAGDDPSLSPSSLLVKAFESAGLAVQSLPKHEDSPADASPFDSTTSETAYCMAQLSGLLQFAHVDPVIDRFRYHLWASWCITARAAVTLHTKRRQSKPKLSRLMRNFEERMARRGRTVVFGSRGKEASSPLINSPLQQMNDEIKHLGEVICDGEMEQTSFESVAVGEWDEDRKRWLLQWVNNQDMV